MRTTPNSLGAPTQRWQNKFPAILHSCGIAAHLEYLHACLLWKGTTRPSNKQINGSLLCFWSVHVQSQVSFLLVVKVVSKDQFGIRAFSLHNSCTFSWAPEINGLLSLIYLSESLALSNPRGAFWEKIWIVGFCIGFAGIKGSIIKIVVILVVVAMGWKVV